MIQYVLYILYICTVSVSITGPSYNPGAVQVYCIQYILERTVQYMYGTVR